MEAQIKEETRESSLCFETSGDNLANLSIVEKYDRFIHNESSEISDSDGDFFPDDTILRKEYAQLTSGASGVPRAKNHRLSTGIPGRFRSLPPTDCDPYYFAKDTGNGTSKMGQFERASDANSTTLKNTESTQARIDELIEKLNQVRRTDPDGNSIFCEQSELETIQERYGAILDYVHEVSPTFEIRSSSKDSENDEQVDVGSVACVNPDESTKLLSEKIARVQQARDRFYEIEQLVKEQVEQLELVERYKMESVG